MCYKIFIIYAVVVGTTTYSYIKPANKNVKPALTKHTNWTFKDYLEKYNPRKVWDKIEKIKKKGVKLTLKQEIDLFMKGIDMTDDFLKLKVEDGDAKLLIMKDGRRWRPPPGLWYYWYDKFSLRRRLYELMKQAIYQARNKMVIMQRLRNSYRDTSLYKMGYVTSKADNTAKTLSTVAYRAYHACSLARQGVTWRHRVYGILASEERVLNLWFTLDLLIDIIRKNDQLFKDVLSKGTNYPKEDWKFTN